MVAVTLSRDSYDSTPIIAEERLVRHPLSFVALCVIGLTGCGDDSTSSSDPGLDFIDLRAEDIGSTRAVIRFQTSRETTCEAEYGLAVDVLDQTATDPSMGPELYAFDHEVPLEDLQPATAYYYRARALDPDGRTYHSETLQFTTQAAAQTQLIDFAQLSQGASIAAVSSNFGGAANSATWGADFAIDGLTGTEWATNGDGDDAWIDIDLGVERTISRVEFRSRRMPDGSSIIRSFQLRLSADAILGPFDTPDPDVLYGVDLTPPIVKRRVIVEAVTTTGGNTGAREIRLLGSE